MKTVTIHMSVDFDAVGSAWLIRRWLGEEIQVRFVRSGETDETADFVLDTGGELDPSRGRYDHHQLGGADARISATKLVFQEMQRQSPGTWDYLTPLVEMIDEGDWGRGYDVVEQQGFLVRFERTAGFSRELGIHAMLSSKKARREPDEALVAWGFEILDLLADRMEQQAIAKRDLADNIIARGSNWVVLAENAPRGCTQAAYDEGIDVVFYQSAFERDGSAVHVRGMVRRNEAAALFHCGDAVAETVAWLNEQCRCLINDGHLDTGFSEFDVLAELESWFQHPAGFFAGISEKAGGASEPPKVSLVEIARAIMEGVGPNMHR